MTEHCTRSPGSATFPAGGPGQATKPPPHLCPHTHSSAWAREGRHRNRSSPQLLPSPRTCHPVATYQSTPPEGSPTHLGKLGDAPGPVSGRAAVGGPPAPGPSLLHGPQDAQLQAPRERRLQRTGEKGWFLDNQGTVSPLEDSELLRLTNPY